MTSDALPLVPVSITTFAAESSHHSNFCTRLLWAKEQTYRSAGTDSCGARGTPSGTRPEKT